MPKLYTHEDFDDWSMEETPGLCMYYGRSNHVCGDPAVRVTDLLRFHDGCSGMIWVCADERHHPRNVELSTAT